MKISSLFEILKKHIDLGFIKFNLKSIRLKIDMKYNIYLIIKNNPSCRINENALIYIKKNIDKLLLGKNVEIKQFAQLNCISENGFIKIGNNCLVSENNILYGQGQIEIGNNVAIGPNVIILSMQEDFSFEQAKKTSSERPRIYGKIIIKDHVVICTAAIITKGVTIGEGALICAGALVMHDVEPWTVVAGIPAKPIRKR